MTYLGCCYAGIFDPSKVPSNNRKGETEETTDPNKLELELNRAHILCDGSEQGLTRTPKQRAKGIKVP